jgi:aryl-alcohol dehydrogenase-like predicted oxidoreductase
VLVGARDPAQLDGSLAAVGVGVAAEVLQELERIFPA